MRRTLIAAAVIASTAITAVAIAQETDTRQPQGSSVGEGTGPAPSFAAPVRRAATRAGCRLKAFKSAGIQHGVGSFSYQQIPPTSGTHAGRWADYGLYGEPVPHQYQVHNLEHGGVVVHYANGLSDSAAKALGEFAAVEPGYLVLTPRASKTLKPAEPRLRLRAFPNRGFVVTSWQRRMVCKSGSARAMGALRTYARTYRGAGPEQVPAYNSTQERPSDLPEPEVNTGNPDS